MALTEYESIKSLEVITQDAQILGRVVDVRFEDLTWNIQGLKVKSESKVSKIINVSGKSMVLLQPSNYVIGDVILMTDTLDIAKVRVAADNEDFRTVSSLIGCKVLSEESVIIGTVDSIQLDLDNRTVASMKVKLDKSAYEPLEIKKGLLGKKVSGLLMSHISEITKDSIKLNLNIFGVRSQVTVD